MGLKVLLDQNARQSSSSNTSNGLLLGTTTQQLRILYLVPTPKTPPGMSPHRWSVEHANLIRPMCPGGLSILGTYLPLRGTSPSSSKDLESAAAIARDITAQPQNSQPSLVLCRGPKGRVVVKQVGPNENDRLTSADLKELPHLTNNVIPVRATLSIPHTLFPIVYNFDTPARLKSACYSIADKLMSGSILQLPGQLHTIVTNTDDSRTLAETMGWKTTTKPRKQSSFSNEPIDVQLLTPICVDCDYDTSSTDPIQSSAKLGSVQGSLHLEAVTTSDATIGDVLKVLQLDLLRSLRTRVDLLIESHLPEPDDDSDSETQWNQPHISEFPARVVATPVSPSLRFLSLTEYLMPGESIDEDLMSRFLEAFSWDEEKFEEFKVEQKEQHHPETTENGEISCPIATRTDEASSTASTNAVLDIPFIMQSCLLAAVVLGFLAIIIKQLLDFL